MIHMSTIKETSVRHFNAADTTLSNHINPVFPAFSFYLLSAFNALPSLEAIKIRSDCYLDIQGLILEPVVFLIW